MAGGRLKAKNLYFPIALENNEVYFQGKKCSGAYSKATGKVGLTFSNIGVDNPMVSGIIVFKGSLEETDFIRQSAIKEEFDKIYELESKKKEFDKYYVLNKYAKQKKRKRNFLFDRGHHYETILEEANQSKTGGILKLILYVIILSALVGLYFQVKSRIELINGLQSGTQYAKQSEKKVEDVSTQKQKDKKKKK